MRRVWDGARLLKTQVRRPLSEAHRKRWALFGWQFFLRLVFRSAPLFGQAFSESDSCGWRRLDVCLLQPFPEVLLPTPGQYRNSQGTPQ
jgi:hypothetical protein